MKIGKFFILGDSYSTFEGYIPQGFAPYYVCAGREDNNVTSVEQTWWRLLAKDTDAELIYNCSWSGTTICNTGYDGMDYSHRSFITNFDSLAERGFFADNQIDTFFVFGGTNDSWANAPLGEEKYADWSLEDLYCVKPAISYLANRLRETCPSTRVIFIVNTDIKQEIADCMINACRQNGHGVIVLENIDKQDGHPTIVGMKQIEMQIIDYVKETD